MTTPPQPTGQPETAPSAAPPGIPAILRAAATCLAPLLTDYGSNLAALDYGVSILQMAGATDSEKALTALRDWVVKAQEFTAAGNVFALLAAQVPAYMDAQVHKLTTANDPEIVDSDTPPA